MTEAEALALSSAVIAGLQQLLNMYESAKSGSVSPAQALAAIQAMQLTITNDNAVIDAAEAAKFPSTP